METTIQTDEPIEINLYQSSYGDDSVYIQLTDETGTYDYASLNHTTIDALDLEELKIWVEETYYCLSYRSEQYIAGHIDPAHFRK